MWKNSRQNRTQSKINDSSIFSSGDRPIPLKIFIVQFSDEAVIELEQMVLDNDDKVYVGFEQMAGRTNTYS